MPPVTPSFRLDGRRALVTGAGRGLGSAMAAALSEAGAHVVSAARDGAALPDAIAELSGRGLRAGSVVADVADHQRFAALIEAGGPSDILANNAGTDRAKPGLDVSEDDCDAVTGLDAKAACFAALAVARGMTAAGRGGSIIDVSSQTGHVSSPTFIVTDLTHGYLEGPEFRAGVLDKIALQRLGGPADVMGAVVFHASALMTGSALMLDGGRTAA